MINKLIIPSIKELARIPSIISNRRITMNLFKTIIKLIHLPNKSPTINTKENPITKSPTINTKDNLFFYYFFFRLASRLPTGEQPASFQRRHAFARSCSPAARQLASRLARIWQQYHLSAEFCQHALKSNSCIIRTKNV